MMGLPVLLCWLLRAPNRTSLVVRKLDEITYGGDFGEPVSSGLVIKKSPCGDKGQHSPSGLAMKRKSS
jgi:hypothetical protein